MATPPGSDWYYCHYPGARAGLLEGQPSRLEEITPITGEIVAPDDLRD
jgi:hypothetical protein